MAVVSSLDAFVAHCGECGECADSLRDEVGYPGLCGVGLRLWTCLTGEKQERSAVLVWPNESRACRYVYNSGSYTKPPEYCDNDAEPGSEFCAVHQYADDDYDNSDEPYDC